MAKLYYPAILEAGESGGFGVFFPDLDGCVSSGETPQDAARMAEEALALHLEGMAETGEAIPSPSDILVKLVDADVSVAAVMLIGAEEPKSSERVNVWLPTLLLERVDRAASARGQNRSSFLAAAARLALDGRRDRAA